MGNQITRIKKTVPGTKVDPISKIKRRYKKTKNLVQIPEAHRFFCTSCGGYHYIKFHDVSDDTFDV